MPKPINRTIRLDEDTERDLQTLARDDRRSLNNMIEVLIVAEVRRRVEADEARRKAVGS